MSTEQEITLFETWNYSKIEVKDPGLKRYLSLKPVEVPHSMGRHEHGRFRKEDINIVERLINNLDEAWTKCWKKSKVGQRYEECFRNCSVAHWT